MAGLLGLGGISGAFGAQPPAGLLGPFYNPADMRKQQLKQGLLQAGIGMLTNGKGSTGEVLGQSLGAGLQGANQAGINYRQDAMGYNQIDMQMKEQKDKERQKAATMQYIDELPDDQKQLAMVNPQKFAEMHMENLLKIKEGGGLTDDIKEFNYGLQNPEFGKWLTDNKKAGATNITVGGGKYGTIPPGYELVETPQGAQLRAIPGGPAAAEQQAASETVTNRDNKKATLTDTIVGAAATARKLSNGLTTGIPGQLMKNLGPSDSAEIYRQTEVLKSNAKIENLNAMRRESKTGGALGAVTQNETEMLAAAAGALDPSAGSERYKAALDNYERTLLQIVHGYEAGNKIFEQTREQSSDGWTTLPNGVKIRKKAQ